MNARPKAIGGYLAGWVLVIFFVLLLTLIFNFVGTIICAALGGMMMGAARLPAWQSLALSLVFPGVISTFLRVTKAELPPTQIAFLALLCFGIFWVIYLVVWALVRQEHAQPAGASARRAGVSTPRLDAQPPAGDDSSELTLEALQGNWFAGNSNSSPGHRHRAMEISQDTLVLSLTDASGQVCSRAKAHLKLCHGSVLALDSQTRPEGFDPEAEVSI